MDMAARMAMNTDIMTPDAEQMLILQNWFSPTFPVGAFSYSGGLETAIARGDIYDRDSLAGWLRQTLLHGSVFMDAVFLRATMEGEDVNDLCLALCAGAERYQETTELGAAFGRVMRETQVMELPVGLAYPVAVGMAARALALPLKATVAVANTRSISKADMVHNAYCPQIEVHPETYEVRADGELLTCEPAAELPMAQRYFMF